MSAEAYDVVVVGGGTAGAFAAAAVADEGHSVALLERKSEGDAGHIACGDAIKGKSSFPNTIDLEYLREESFTNDTITHARFENPQSGESMDIGFGGVTGAVVDRKRYGEVLLEEASRIGADVRYETVVHDVIQDSAVQGVKATRNGSVTNYEADIVIDAAGALSLLQDKADFSDASFDTNVDYSQFCSAYREVIELETPVEWTDTLVFKPTQELGYLWYFPRSATEINVGLGFQMNKPPMKLVEVLKDDLKERAEFAGARVKDKLGAALPTRRPYDSAVAPGYLAVGDAAGHVNPITGGGIPGAAKAGHWAAQAAVEAISDGVPDDEDALWEYNHRVMTDFGKKFAAMDLYNIWGGATDLDEILDVITKLPAGHFAETVAKSGSTSMGLVTKVKTAAKTVGHWDMLYDLWRVNRKSSELKNIYNDYPTSADDFDQWIETRDELLEEVYEITGAESKY
ncbi:geranylgeranyl reductase family protein [Halocatena pleomorpha]|uniref:Geranylgeranyl reductase family protein n=1 Tax=Halocatena pleomorpha TaxID=1785090 RepID=A0A3P3RJI7_9EURY|nr:geranylgeranyl reductase family protein [Halocatena pleomorpha]RRJ33088.1 geranylgeranyl reductase family protein [Halocatena pleomorpha]